MRRCVAVAAVCGALWCGSAQAAVQVSTGNTFTCSCVGAGSPGVATLSSFDSSLGTLTGITLQIDALAQTQYLANQSTRVSSTYHGTFHTIVNGNSYYVPVAGAVDAVIGSYPGLVLDATGSETFTLDTSLFSLFINSGGISVWDNDYTYPFVFDNDVELHAIDAGDTGHYTLTYTYIPLGESVPEPSTWALMLLGFGGIGIAIRRNPRFARPLL